MFYTSVFLGFLYINRNYLVTPYAGPVRISMKRYFLRFYLNEDNRVIVEKVIKKSALIDEISMNELAENRVFGAE